MPKTAVINLHDHRIDPLRDLWTVESLMENVLIEDLECLSKADRQIAGEALQHILERTLELFRQQPSRTAR